MHIFWGGWFTAEKQSVDMAPVAAPVKETNNSVTRRIDAIHPDAYYGHWFQNAFAEGELKEHYWAASFLLPLGSILVLAMIVLLMILFKRCPYMIAAIVAGILGTIILFVVLMSINDKPTYV